MIKATAKSVFHLHHVLSSTFLSRLNFFPLLLLACGLCKV